MIQQPYYNPALLTDDQLKRSFVARTRELNDLLAVIRNQPQKGSFQHVLIVGSRGMGKTMLGLRLLLAVREDPKLSANPSYS